MPRSTPQLPPNYETALRTIYDDFRARHIGRRPPEQHDFYPLLKEFRSQQWSLRSISSALDISHEMVYRYSRKALADTRQRKIMKIDPPACIAARRAATKKNPARSTTTSA